MDPTAPSPSCLSCGAALACGFLLTRDSDGGTNVPDWYSGQPEVGAWGRGWLKERERAPVEAWRCPSCGRIELYAGGGGA